MAFCALVNFAGFLSIKLGKSHLFKCTKTLKNVFFICPVYHRTADWAI